MEKDEKKNPAPRSQPTMSVGPELVDLFTAAYAANLPVMLEGGHGVGKSEICQQAAQKLNIECTVIDLSIIEPVDLSGMPHMEDGRTVYAPPSILPSTGRGLLVFEELNRCPRYLQAPCLQLLTARRLNEYILPDGWLPCACINPSNDKYQTYELDPALLSRFIHVKVKASVRKWVAWAKANQLHEMVVSFVEEREKLFDSDFSTPRSWTYVSQFLKMAEETNVNLNLRKVIVSGLIGKESMDSLMEYITDSSHPITIDQILKTDDCINRIEAWKRESRMDLIYTTLCTLMTYLQSRENRLLCTKTQIQRIVKFISILPGDMREEGNGFLNQHTPSWLKE